MEVPDADQALQVHAEQTLMLYSGLAASLPGALSIAAVLAFFQWDLIEHYLIIGWCLVFVLVTLARAALALAYFRALPPPDRTRPWHSRFVAGTLAAGAIWGAGAWLLFPAQSAGHQAFMGVLIAGLTAGAVKG